MEAIKRSASCIYCQQPYQREPHARRPVVRIHCGAACFRLLRLHPNPEPIFCSHTPLSHIPLSRPLLLCRFTHAFTRPAVGVRCSWRVRVQMVHSHARAAQRCAPNPRTNCLKMQSRSSCFQPQQQVEHFLVQTVCAKMRPQCIAAHATGPFATIAAPLPTAKVQ